MKQSLEKRCIVSGLRCLDAEREADEHFDETYWKYDEEKAEDCDKVMRQTTESWGY